MSKWKCPLCGEPRGSTKEHVWPKWLRNEPMLQELLRSAHGERFRLEYADLQRDEGRLIEVQRSVNVATWVPQITATVCTSCNSGWMSRLESRVKRTLSSVVAGTAQASLDGARAHDLARWAVKTSMTYQVALKMQQGCFRPAEMRRMATHQEVPSRCKVWVRSMPGQMQWVAAQYRGLVMPDAHDVEEMSLRDNLALTLIGIPRLIFVVGVAPSVDDTWLLDALLPNSFGTRMVPQIWPDPGQIDLPTTDKELEFDTATLFEGIAALGSVSGPSLTELSPEALSNLLQKDHRPPVILEAMLEQFLADCQSEDLDLGKSMEAWVGGDVRFTQEQLGVLFTASLALINKHADHQPKEVSRRLYNLAHVFFSSDAHVACLVLVLLCASVPGGGYESRPDVYELAGHAAWQIAAFGVAAEMYETQRTLEPDSSPAKFNVGESAFMSGDFARAGESLSSLDADDDTPLGDTLACLRVTVGLILDKLGVAGLEGFRGPTVEEVFDLLVTGSAPSFDLALELRKRILSLLEDLDDVDPGAMSIARAYLTDSVADWASAAVSLLESPSRRELKPVLRKGASCGPTFELAFQEQLVARGCPTLLPDGADAVEFIRSHAYARRHRTVRLLDEDNAVLEVI